MYPFGQRVLQKPADLGGGCRYHDSPGSFKHASFQVVRQFGRMCIRMVRFCRFADALRMLG